MVEYTKLRINCKWHGRQLAIGVMGGEIWCKKCQLSWYNKEVLKKKSEEKQ